MLWLLLYILLSDTDDEYSPSASLFEKVRGVVLRADSEHVENTNLCV